MGIGPPVSLAALFALVFAAYAGGGRTPGAPLSQAREPRKSRETRKSEELKALLQMNAEDGFDLEALNSIDMRALEEGAVGEKQILREVMQKVEALMPRVRSETENTALAGAILRNKTLDWYRRSPYPGWAERMAPRWSGIFHESKVPGGRLSPKLSSRLASLHMECARATGWFGALHRSRGIAKILAGGLMRPHQPLMPQVAQAYLDDLAASRRNADRPLGLERLSEVSRRIGSPEMNRVLGELFPHDGRGLIIVLDPRYHQDIGGVMIRLPPAKAVGDAITYDLVHAKASHSRESNALDFAATEASPSSPWERGDITKKDWLGLLGQLQKGKAKLDPPPIENYRNHELYLGLRDLILTDSSALKAFLAVHWRGRPSGLALLAQLLSEGTFAPDAETDGDYLEGELGHIEKGDPNHRPKDGRWKLGHGWTVVRVQDGNEHSYRAGRTAKD